MQIPDSGKIAIGVVAGVVVIAVLHLTVFKGRAQEFQRAREEYNSVRNKYVNLIGTANLTQIYAFKYKALKYHREYWELIKNLNLTVPDYFFPQPTDTERIAAEQKQRQHFIDLLASLEKRRDEPKALKLTFLSKEWELQTSLPQEIRGRGINVEDLIGKLRDGDRVLKVLDRTQPIFQERERSYLLQLKQLGLDTERRAAIARTQGKIPAALYTLNRIQLVRAALGDRYFKDMTPIQADDMMYDLFRMEWPKDPNPLLGTFPYYRQSQNLSILLDMAKAASIDEIVSMSLRDPMPSYFDPAGVKAGGAATPTPAPTVQVAPGFDHDEGGEVPTPQQVAGKQMAAFGSPFLIIFTGTNIASMEFLHSIARTPVPLELDSLYVESVKGAESLQRVTAFVNGIDFVMDAFFRPSQVDTNIVKTYEQLFEVAKRAGGREEAIKDGLIDESGKALIPMPTPVGDVAAATATPAEEVVAAPATQ